MSVKYRSTRGDSLLSFEDVVLNGLADDRGLYIPAEIPLFTTSELDKLRGLSFADLAFEIISKFVDPEDIPTDKLKDIVDRSYCTTGSDPKWLHADVTPSLKLEEFWVLELFHGPTLAFKDVALQFLGNLFEFFLERGLKQKEITILGATSGDTGSAAIHGLRGKKNVECFIMYPEGKVTNIQERQMTTIPDENVHCINITGTFDDAQEIVKNCFGDEDFKKTVHLGAINSINWARVLAQITYYFYSWFQITKDLSPEQIAEGINYCVPTGNFGDILAGYYAKRMGLGIDKLVVCTNQNKVLHNFLETGKYQKTDFVETIAPSMDISVSSNFERYLFYLSGENHETLAGWMSDFETKKGHAIDVGEKLQDAKEVFLSCAATEEDIIDVMAEIYDSKDKYLLCPHTATAAFAVRKLKDKLPAERTVCLATASPHKFEKAVRKAMEKCKVNKEVPTLPDSLQQLNSLTPRTHHEDNNFKQVQKYIKYILEEKSGRRKGPWYTSGIAISAMVAITAAAAVAFIVLKRR